MGRRADVEEAPPDEQPGGDLIERRDITAKPPPREPVREPPGRSAGEGGRQRPGRRPGLPFDRRSPFLVGFLAALGGLIAIAIGAIVYSIRGTLVLVFLALFIAVGLEGVVSFLVRNGVRRQLAVLVVVLAAAAVVAAFVYSAISPIQHEFHQLSTHVPTWRHEVATRKGTIGHIANDLHLTYYLSQTGSSTLTATLESGAIGAGKRVLTAVSSLLVVVVLTIYFLVAWPSIKRFFVQLVPESRRRRFSLLLDDVTAGVGGFLLGNLFTSLVAGLGTYLWATAFGIPYSILLALLVALFDLVPVVGSTVAGVVVSLVALAVSVPVAIGTAAFYTLYRFVEDYLLVRRVMRHAVNVSPALTVLATIVGGALLGIIGALVAIPVAAGIKLVVEQSVFPRLDRS